MINYYPVMDEAGQPVIVDTPTWFKDHQGETFYVRGDYGKMAGLKLVGRSLETANWFLGLDTNERNELRYVSFGNKAIQKIELTP